MCVSRIRALLVLLLLYVTTVAHMQLPRAVAQPVSLYTYSLQHSLFIFNATGKNHSTFNIVKNTPGAQLNITFTCALLVGTSPTDPTAACRLVAGNGTLVLYSNTVGVNVAHAVPYDTVVDLQYASFIGGFFYPSGAGLVQELGVSSSLLEEFGLFFYSPAYNTPFLYYISDGDYADHDIFYTIDGGHTGDGTGADAIQVDGQTLAGSLDVSLPSSQPQVQLLSAAVASSTVQYVFSLNTTLAKCVDAYNSSDCTGPSVGLDLHFYCTFVFGASSSSVDSVYLITNVSGTYLNSTGMSVVVSSLVPVLADAASFYQSDNLLTPYDIRGRILNNNGILLTLATGERLALYATYASYLNGSATDYHYQFAVSSETYGVSYVHTDVLPQVALVSSTTPAAAIGDPTFVGFLGQRYQVHGIDGAIYAVLSQATLAVNARFVFLSAGRCPTVDGVVSTNCWSHPGSYFGALSFQTTAGDRLSISAGSADVGFASIMHDDQQVATKVGTIVRGAALSLQVLSSHIVMVEVGNYRVTVENSDKFVNLVAVEVLNWRQLRSVDQPHGLLGQTYSMKKGTASRPAAVSAEQVLSAHSVVDGDVDDYLIVSNDLFAVDFVYNKFV